MKRSFLLLLVLALLLLAGWLAPIFKSDPGHVVINFADWTIETSVLVLATAFLILWFIVQIIAWGTSFYSLGVLGKPLVADTGWSNGIVFAGLTVGLLDISKTKGDIFLDRVESQLNEQGVKTLRFKKPTFTRPAPAELIQDIATQCDVVVEALAD